MKGKKVHIWFPGSNGSIGGIQAYCRVWLEAIGQIRPMNQLEVWIKNDLDSSLDQKVFRTHCFGRYPGFVRTLFFSTQIFFGALFQKPSWIICGHSNFLPVAYFIKRITGIPYVLIAHGVEVWRLSFGQKKYLAASKKILAVSRFTQTKIQEQTGLADSNFYILSNTADAVRFSVNPSARFFFLKKWKLSNKAKILLSVGRLSASERYKGQDFVIQAMPALLKRFPDAQYFIVGEGDDRARLEKIANDLDVTEHVVFVGKVSEVDLPGYYQSCDVFVLPSCGEGFGIVYLEALFCGKSVISSDADAAQEVLMQGQLGRSVPWGDSQALLNVVSDVLTKPFSSPHALRELAILHYGPKKFKEGLKNFFEMELEIKCVE